MSEKTDVLLVTTADVERDAVLRAAAKYTRTKATLYVGQSRTLHLLGRIGGSRILMVQTEQGTSTPGGSLPTLLKVISEIRPSEVIMVGIAFGVDPEKQDLGTVLVSRQIQQYEVQRVGTESEHVRIIPRGDRATASVRLLSLIRAASVGLQRVPVFGLLLSGEKLVDNEAYRTLLTQFEPEAVGGEMEGGGLYVAALEEKVDWLVVKAICDWADGSKGQDKRRRQRLAAGRAASLVMAALNKRGGVSPDDPPLGAEVSMSYADVAIDSTRDTGNTEPKSKDAPKNLTILVPASTAVTLPDIWTPGYSKEHFTRGYSAQFGTTVGAEIWRLSQRAIQAVAFGDFQEQVRIAAELRSMADGNAFLLAESSYFSAEGLRLLGDIEENETKRRDLRARADAEYRAAIERNPSDPRPLRGLGRTLELQDHYDEALQLFTQAKGLSLQQSLTDPKRTPALAHELLRSTRHLVHCVLAIKRSNVGNWNREHKVRQIEGYVIECENFHRELLPFFRGSERWWRIEWFMGLTFIAKAWAALGNKQGVHRALIHALVARRKIMSSITAELEPVERANLHWWLSGALGTPEAFSRDSLRLVELIAESVHRGSASDARTLIDALLFAEIPPWESVPNS